jgi:hypothetical protein
VHRNLVLLFALLSAGPTIDEAAECVAHLMYSAALTPASALHLNRSIAMIYGQRGWENERISMGSLDLRGGGKLHAIYPTNEMKKVLNMFQSSYGLQEALQSMRSIMLSPQRADYRDRYLSSLSPGHRLAFMRYRASGILAPFSMDLSAFTTPNRYGLEFHA